MTSEIRANTLKNRVGLGTVSFTNTGPVVSGIVTATSFVGSGANLTNINSTSATGDFSIADKIVHTGDTDTAIRFPGTDIITMERSGSEVFRLDGSGLKIPDKLIHQADTDTAIRFPANDTVTVETAGTERFRITSGGLVGVNCTPVGMLEVQKNGVPAIIANYNNSKHLQMGAGGSGAGFHLTDGHFFTINHQPYADRGTDNNLTERLRIDSNGYLSFAGDTDTYIHHPTANQLAITRAGGSAPLMRWGTGGNGVSVGINTDGNLVTGGEILSIRGYTSIKSFNYNYAALYTHNESEGGSNICSHILFNVSGANRGGFGYDTDNSTLIFNNQNSISLRTGATGLNGTERLRIDTSGHLHTGYTSGFGGDHVNILATDGGGISIATNNAGNASTNDVLGSYSFQGYLNGQTHTNAEAKISGIAAANHTGSSAATDMVFYTKPSTTGPGSAPTERLRMTSTGLHKITTSGNITDGTYFSTLTINNTGSNTWSRLRFDRSGVAKWGLSLGTDDKFRISNLYTDGTSSSADDDTFVISNSGNISISGYLSGKPSPGNGNNQFAKGRHYQWNQTNLSPSDPYESGWYPIMDINDGQYMFLIETNAHNSATCLVTNGYDDSRKSRINVLNSVRNANGNYLNIQQIRVLKNGVVEVYLYASNPAYFQMEIQMISSGDVHNFYTTLTKNTGSPDVDDTKNFDSYSSSVGDGLMHVETLRVDNALSKSSGSFTIPHPLLSKKDTHYLNHSFIEGPQCDNIYRGKVTLSSGAATVNLDTVSDMTEGTFVVLNRDVQCFTTNETGWGAIKGSVSGNILTISAQDGSSTDTISWMVVGERQDDAIKASGLTDDDGNLIVEVELNSNDDTLTGSTFP